MTSKNYINKIKIQIILLISGMFLFSCSQKEERERPNTFAPKVVEAKGYVLPKDSMAEPKVVLVDESKIQKIPVGKPKVVPTNTNVHIAGEPKIVVAGTPKVIIPGQDTFPLPKTIPANYREAILKQAGSRKLSEQQINIMYQEMKRNQ